MRRWVSNTTQHHGEFLLLATGYKTHMNKTNITVVNSSYNTLLSCYHCTYEWPQTTCPTPTALQLWKHFLQLSFLPPLSFSQCLVQPLGPWLPNVPLAWEWWYSPSQSSLLRQIDDQWLVWTHSPSTYRQHRYHQIQYHSSPTPL